MYIYKLQSLIELCGTMNWASFLLLHFMGSLSVVTLLHKSVFSVTMFVMDRNIFIIVLIVHNLSWPKYLVKNLTKWLYFR